MDIDCHTQAWRHCERELKQRFLREAKHQKNAMFSQGFYSKRLHPHAEFHTKWQKTGSLNLCLPFSSHLFFPALTSGQIQIREGLLPCRVSSKMKIRLALDQFSLPPSPSADFHFATLSAWQYFFPAQPSPPARACSLCCIMIIYPPGPNPSISIRYSAVFKIGISGLAYWDLVETQIKISIGWGQSRTQYWSWFESRPNPNKWDQIYLARTLAE